MNCFHQKRLQGASFEYRAKRMGGVMSIPPILLARFISFAWQPFPIWAVSDFGGHYYLFVLVVCLSCAINGRYGTGFFAR